jgi:tetratricopeptide (TPR) repeat protein
MADKILLFMLLIGGVAWLSLASAGNSRDFIKALEDNGMIDEAISEYKRLLFFDELNEEEKGIIWLKLAVCHREINDDVEMMKAFNRSFICLRDSPYIQDLYLEIAIFYLSRGKTDWARSFLGKINLPVPAESAKKYLILSYIMDEDWKTFFLCLKEEGLDQPVLLDIREHVRHIKKMKRKYKILMTLEYFLPGISYVFQSDIFEAGESFLFHFFFIHQIVIESAIPGKIIFALSLSRLYLRSLSGNRQYLKKKIEEKRMILEEKIFKKMALWWGN